MGTVTLTYADPTEHLKNQNVWVVVHISKLKQYLKVLQDHPNRDLWRWKKSNLIETRTKTPEITETSSE